MPPVRALQRGMQVMFEVLDRDRPVSVGEIAQRTQLPKPTVSRLLGTLVKDGYLSHNPVSGYYTLGPEVLRRFLVPVLDTVLKGQIRESMVRLRDASGETASAWVPAWPDRFCIDQVESRSGLRRVHDIGEHRSLTAGAVGRAYLAFVDDTEMESALKVRPLEALTPYSTVSPYDFRKELKRTRERGYTISVAETILGMAGVAAPIFDREDRPIAMISVSGPESRWSLQAMEEFATLLLAETADLSKISISTVGEHVQNRSNA